MLAYVFWHHPAPNATEYDQGLARFHRALAAHPPAGFLRSASFFVAGLPWAPGKAVYEDWYAIEDFTALGRLNDWAVTGAMKAPHDDIAARSAWGTGAVYKLLSGKALAEVRSAAWFSARPESFDGTLWQRQLALGPAPEFCIHAAGEIEGGFAIHRVF